MVRECTIKSSNFNNGIELQRLELVDQGFLLCWKDEDRQCRSDCAAWRYKDPQTICCMALPHCSPIADISEC